MKYLITIAALLFTSVYSNAQDTAGRFKYAAKVYALASQSHAEARHTGLSSYKHTDYISPSVALTIGNKRGNIHEFELTSLSVDQADVRIQRQIGNITYTATGLRLTTSSVMLRYEYSINLIKNRMAKFSPSIGLAGAPYYYRNAYSPYTTASFPMSETYIGLKGFFVPRLTWNINRRIFVDANVPLCILDISHRTNTYSDPSLNKQIQRYSIVNLELLPKYFSARLGLGIRF